MDPDKWLEEVNKAIDGKANGIIFVLKTTDYRVQTDFTILINSVKVYMPEWDGDRTLFVWTHGDLKKNEDSYYEEYIT